MASGPLEVEVSECTSSGVLDIEVGSGGGCSGADGVRLAPVLGSSECAPRGFVPGFLVGAFFSLRWT